MFGAIAGDFIGSPYEKHGISVRTFPLFSSLCRFTDDSVLTIATADALLTDRDYSAAYRRWYQRYPVLGYGPMFRVWAGNPGQPAPPSEGNGAAMRVSPIGWSFDNLPAALAETARSARASHNSEAAVVGAQAIVHAIVLARLARRKGSTPEGIRHRIRDEVLLHYYPHRHSAASLLKYRMHGVYTADPTVAVALWAVVTTSGVEDAIRCAIAAGGDSDTIAAMAGGVAEAIEGALPPTLANHVRKALGERSPAMLEVTRSFNEKFMRPVV